MREKEESRTSRARQRFIALLAGGEGACYRKIQDTGYFCVLEFLRSFYTCGNFQKELFDIIQSGFSVT